MPGRTARKTSFAGRSEPQFCGISAQNLQILLPLLKFDNADYKVATNIDGRICGESPQDVLH
jgi:hypothetical protein